MHVEIDQWWQQKKPGYCCTHQHVQAGFSQQQGDYYGFDGVHYYAQRVVPEMNGGQSNEGSCKYTQSRRQHVYAHQRKDAAKNEVYPEMKGKRHVVGEDTCCNQQGKHQ